MLLDYLFIGNPPFPNFLGLKSISVVGDEKKLDVMMKKYDPKGIIVQAELAWGGHVRSDFWGIILIRKLRLDYNYNGPIIIASLAFDHKDQFPPTTIGIQYLEDSAVKVMPIVEFEKKSFDASKLHWDQPLNKELYQFLRKHLYIESHYITELLIHKTNGILQNGRTKTEKGASLRKHFESIRSQFPFIAESFNELAKVFLEKFSNEEKLSSTLFNPIVEELEGSKIEIIKDEDVQNQSIHILLIDDSPMEELIKFLKARTFKVHKASDCTHALEILEKDKDNFITVVVCGTLFRDENGRYARTQGGEIIKRLAEHPHIHSTIMLTGAHRSQISDLSQQHHIRFIPLFKQDVLDSVGSAREIFYRTLIEENLWVLENRLIPKKWKREWKIMYKWHREADDFETYENEVAEEAAKWVLKVKNSESDVIDSWPVAPFKFRPRKEPVPEDLQKFRRQLFYRRIAMGLLLLRENRLAKWDKDDLWHTIGNTLSSGRVKPYVDNLKDILFKLQLKRSILDPLNQNPSREEKDWIIKNEQNFKS